MGGLHGTGKTTYAKALAKAFNLRHVSAGEIFRRMSREKRVTLKELMRLAALDSSIDREIDETTQKEAENGSVVIDGQLAAWMARAHADIMFYLSAKDEARFKRIAKRDGISFEEARDVTLGREKAEEERYRRYYNVNIDDLSIYDVVLNTEALPIQSNVRILTRTVEEYLKSRKQTRR